MGFKIDLNLDDGLHTTDQDKLAVYYEPNGLIVLDTDEDNPGLNGIYVNNLNGADGQPGGSEEDNHTVVTGKGFSLYDPDAPSINNFINTNRNVVCCMFTLGVNTPIRRTGSTLEFSSNVKTITNIINEIDAPMNVNAGSFYRPIAGDMIQLVSNPSLTRLKGNDNVYRYYENLRREGQSSLGRQETKVIFIVTSVTYRQPGDVYIDAMSLKCIYSNISSYHVDQDISGTPYFSDLYQWV